MALYAPSDAFSWARTFVKRMPFDSANPAHQTADYIHSLIWTAAPWSWTLGAINNVTVVGGTDDYVPSSPPTDMLYLHAPFIAGSDVPKQEMEPVSVLPDNAVNVGNPTQVWADITVATSTLVKLRVAPIPPTNYSGTLVSLYKKVPPKITVSNYATLGTLAMPDAYYVVYQVGVLWMAYLYSDDPRAGTATVDGNGNIQYTQQQGTFRALLEEMRRAEKLPLTFPGTKQTRG